MSLMSLMSSSSSSSMSMSMSSLIARPVTGGGAQNQASRISRVSASRRATTPNQAVTLGNS